MNELLNTWGGWVGASSLTAWMPALTQIGLILLVQSTLLLGLGLWALHVLQKRSSGARSLLGRSLLLAMLGSVVVSGGLSLSGWNRPPAIWNVSVTSVSLTDTSLPVDSQPADSQEPAGTRVASYPTESVKTESLVNREAVQSESQRPMSSKAEYGAEDQTTPLPERPESQQAMSQETVSSLFSQQSSHMGQEASSFLWLAGVLWLGGAILLFLWWVACHVALMRLRRNAHSVEEAQTSAALAEVCAAQSVRLPLLLCHELVGSPFLTGLLQPAIILPTNNTRLGQVELHAVLVHEVTHLKRRDLWWNALGHIVCALLWPQPLLWMLLRQLEQINEEACDAAVLQGGCSRQHYARFLLEWAEGMAQRTSERVAGAGVLAGRSTLSRRVQAILDGSLSITHSVSKRLRWAIVGGVLISAAVMPFVVNANADTTPVSTEPEISSAQPQLAQQMRQSSAVLSVAFSPDGKYLASSGRDSKVRLWDVATGQLNKVLSGPPQIHAIPQIVFAADGKQLASVSDKVRLWDVTTGQLQRSFAVANPNPYEKKSYGQGFGVSVALSPKNDMVASTGQFLTVHSQDQNGDWKQVVQEKFFYGTVAAFTPDGATLIEAGWNGRLNFWAVAALKNGEAALQGELPMLQKPNALGKANSLSLSADGTLMVVGYNGKVVLWDLTTGKVKQSWTVPNADVSSVALSGDGKSVASASEDKKVRLWNVATGQLRNTFSENTGINTVAFSPDGATLVSSGSDGVIKLRHLKE